MKKARILLLTILLAGCSTTVKQPEINFVGISTGSLATEIDQLSFLEVFPVDEREILGVVSFDEVIDGTLVQATWFSPDDRRMPLGRNTITVQSGAKIVRFSIAAKEDWAPAPYMLDIRARTETGVEGEQSLTASGQVHFFFGMEEEDITSYKEDYALWQDAQAEKRRIYDIQRQNEEAALERAKDLLEAQEAGIGFRFDITKNGTNEIVAIDPMQEDMMPGSTESGAVFSVEVNQAAVMDMSGATILLLSNESDDTKTLIHAGSPITSMQTTEMVTVHVFPEKLRFDWLWKGEKCMATLELQEGTFEETDRKCVVYKEDEEEENE